MKTKTIELYEYGELPENIKAKVLEKHRDINVDYDWWDFIYEDWKEKLEVLGFEEPEISFSGFYSQGDGASFISQRVDIPKFITAQKAKTRFKALLTLLEVGDVTASVNRIDHHYCHSNTVRGNVDMAWNNETDKLMILRDELESLLTETVRRLSKEIYRDLESEYEGLTRDEAVIDTLEANEYTFRANGEMENI